MSYVFGSAPGSRRARHALAGSGAGAGVANPEGAADGARAGACTLSGDAFKGVWAAFGAASQGFRRCSGGVSSFSVQLVGAQDARVVGELTYGASEGGGEYARVFAYGDDRVVLNAVGEEPDGVKRSMRGAQLAQEDLRFFRQIRSHL